MSRIAINTRAAAAPLSGVQRYIDEITRHILVQLDQISPARPLQGVTGHLWEQLALPLALAGRLLWSPSNSGPIAVHRQVLTVHDVAPLDNPSWHRGAFGAWYRYLLPRLIPRVSHVIAISEFTRDRIIVHTRINPGKITVVPHGVAERFRPAEPDMIDSLLSRLGLQKQNYILSLGTIEPRKNLSTLLRAWKNLGRSLRQSLCLVIAGEPGPSRIFADCGSYPDQLGVRWLGRIPDQDLVPLYSGALAFAYPSLYEGFGWPPLEAMACGTPVIASRSTAIPEVVGDAALLVDPRSENEIADAIRLLALSPGLRTQLASQGKNRSAMFTWTSAAARTLKVLQNC